MYDKELTIKTLGDVGPLRFNPYVIKICQQCKTPEKRRYKGFGKPSDPYYCRKCVVNRDEVKQKLSAAASKQWENPEFRDCVVKNSKKIWEDPDRRKRMDRIRTDPIFKPVHQRHLAELNSDTPKVSSIQHILYSILDDLGVKYFCEHQDSVPDLQCVIGPYIVDCIVPRTGRPDLIIECQGDYWHNLPGNENRDNRKASYISNNFPNKYEMKYLWEHEFKQKDRVISTLKYWLGLGELGSVDFDLGAVLIKDCPAADYRLFLSKYHYLVNAGRGGNCVGGYLNGELIAVCVFSPLVRQNLPYNYASTKELSRLCIHPKYQKKNFGSWFISRCIKRLPTIITTILSYCDTTFNHDGAVYKAANFTYAGEVPPDYWYVNSEGWVMHKKTLYNHAQSLKMTEAEFALKHNYIKTYGAKKLRFIFTR